MWVEVLLNGPRPFLFFLALFTGVRGRGILRSSRSPVMQQVGNRDDNPLCHRTRGMQLVTRLYRLAGSRIQKGLEC
jgi:hypothetical protein